MVGTKTTAAAAVAEKPAASVAASASTKPDWRLTIHTVHPPVDEFEELHKTESSALSRIEEIIREGGVSQFGNDVNNNTFVRFTPISNILYLEVHKKID